MALNAHGRVPLGVRAVRVGPPSDHGDSVVGVGMVVGPVLRASPADAAAMTRRRTVESLDPLVGTGVADLVAKPARVLLSAHLRINSIGIAVLLDPLKMGRAVPACMMRLLAVGDAALPVARLAVPHGLVAGIAVASPPEVMGLTPPPRVLLAVTDLHGALCHIGTVTELRLLRHDPPLLNDRLTVIYGPVVMIGLSDIADAVGCPSVVRVPPTPTLGDGDDEVDLRCARVAPVKAGVDRLPAEVALWGSGQLFGAHPVIAETIMTALFSGPRHEASSPRSQGAGCGPEGA